MTGDGSPVERLPDVVRVFVHGDEVIPLRAEPINWRFCDGTPTCLCGDTDCWHFPDYPWCRPCAEHHRAPECAVNQQGEALAACGCRWTDLAADPHSCKHYT